MDRKPNILVFFTDQQRWDTCGCYNPQQLICNVENFERYTPEIFLSTGKR